CFFAQDASGNSVPVNWSVSTGPGTITPTTSSKGPCQPSNTTGAGPDALFGASYKAPDSPPSGSTSQSVVVTATPLSGSCSNPKTNCSVPFTLTGTTGLSACCGLPVQLTTTVGSTTERPTGVQLTGVPNTSTVQFTLSCSTLDDQGNTQPMPLGSGCIFTLPPKKGGGPLLAF